MRRSILAVAAGLGLLLAGPTGVAAQQQRADSTASASSGSMHGSMMQGMHATMPAMAGMMQQCMAMMGGAGMGTGVGMMGPAGGMGMGMTPGGMGMNMGQGAATGMGMNPGGMGMSMDPGSAMGMMGDAMMAPQTLLRLSGSLDLTPEQAERLQALAADSTASRELQAAAAARQKANGAITGESPSIDDYRVAMTEAADHMVAAQTAVARAALDARAVLTPEQRSRLETGMKMMRGMMGSGMTGSGMGAMHGMRQGTGGQGLH